MDKNFVMKQGAKYQFCVHTTAVSPMHYRLREQMLQEVWGAHWCG